MLPEVCPYKGFCEDSKEKSKDNDDYCRGSYLACEIFSYEFYDRVMQAIENGLTGSPLEILADQLFMNCDIGDGNGKGNELEVKGFEGGTKDEEK